ncbi:MAG TPA: hypothetical protein VNL95_00555 [Dehalococcoidia bacterium]|nr:hypothetical protein [Dehalococcoidia bacterium]
MAAVDRCAAGRPADRPHVRLRRWLLAALGPAMLITLLACGGDGGAEETVTIDGQTLTREEFESIKKAMLEFIDAFAEEDWARVYNLLDAESRQKCSRLEFVTATAGSVGFAKNLLGDQWWQEVRRALREAEDLVRSISWQELQRDPEALERRVEQRLAEIFGPTEEETSDGLEDWRFEDGQARLHWPEACEGLTGAGD